jgi:hypothetical protein
VCESEGERQFAGSGKLGYYLSAGGFDVDDKMRGKNFCLKKRGSRERVT